MKLKYLYKILDTDFCTTFCFYSINDKDRIWNSRYIGFFSKKDLTNNIDFNIDIKKLYKLSESENTVEEWIFYISENDFQKLEKIKKSRMRY